MKFAWLVLLPGCEILGLGESDGPGDGDDDDSGSSTSDDDDDASGDPDCRDPYPTPDPGSAGLGDCVTASLACGDLVRGTVEGGSTVFSNEYEAAFEQCSGHGTGDELVGPERVYLLDTTGYDYASVRLVSCEKLQLLWYQTDQVCPAERVNCSYVGVNGAFDQSEDILLSGSGVLWFVVEGLGGAGGNFELSVECGER